MKRILRVSVRVWETVRVNHPNPKFVHVAPSREFADGVDVWYIAESGSVDIGDSQLRIFATNHVVDNSMSYVGTAVMANELVWHVFEVYPPDRMERILAAQKVIASHEASALATLAAEDSTLVPEHKAMYDKENGRPHGAATVTMNGQKFAATNIQIDQVPGGNMSAAWHEENARLAAEAQRANRN